MAHTASRACVDLDHHSPQFREDPYGTFRRMRESGCPLTFSDAYGEFWGMVDYAQVFDATRDDDLFSSCPTVGVPPNPVAIPILPIETDPPQTKELRAVTLRQFSPASAEKLRPVATELTTELIDGFIERGQCDIAGELTTRRPARLILRMLNFDQSRYRNWLQWVHSTVHDRIHEPDKAAAAGMEMFSEIARHISSGVSKAWVMICSAISCEAR